MSIIDSNYSNICCPFCDANISQNQPILTEKWVDCLADEDCDFFQCQKCNIFFRAKLNVYTEDRYTISKPTKDEIEEYGLTTNQNVIEDVPGQLFMWDNLFLDKC